MPTADRLIPSSADIVKPLKARPVCHPRAAAKLACSYDGRVPDAEVTRAYAIDDAFRDAHPEWFAMTENARYAREARVWLHDLIVALRASEKLLSDRDRADIRWGRDTFRNHHRLALNEVSATHSGGAT